MNNQRYPKVLFVTGIDTNIGKSYTTGFLARQLMREGVKITTQKLVQTGCDTISEDIELHRQIQGVTLTDEDRSGTTCPYVFSYPCSPHLATQIDQRTIDFEVINKATQTLTDQYETVLLEGAGGLMVPLDEEVTTLDFIASNHYPIVLVTCGRLGSINHTLLSLEVCKKHTIEVYAVAYNEHFNEDSTINASTFLFIREYLKKNFPKAHLWKIPSFDVQKEI